MYTKQFLLPMTTLRTCVFVFALIGLNTAVWSQTCSQPSNLNSTVLASGTVALSWSASSGALSYTVQYRLGSSAVWINGGTVATTGQVLTGLLPETVYAWRVRASCSSYSSVAFFNSGGGVGGNTACSSPSNLSADVTAPTAATLSWSAIEGALYYTVQYRANNLGTWTNAGSVNATSISLSNLLANTVYGWRVKASCSPYSSIALFNTGATGAGGNVSCSQPSNLDAFPLSTTSTELTWSAIQGAQNYTVQYRLSSSSAWITLAPTTSTALVLNGLLENSEYTWRVKASCSEYSSLAIFATGGSGNGSGGSTSCSAPSNTNILAVLPYSATIEWEAQGGALNYTVQYRRESGGAYVTVGTFVVATATITGLIPGTSYVWRVKANCSPYGSDVQFSTPMARSGGTELRQNEAESVKGQVFPNPAMTDAVQVRISHAGAKLRILNAAGQLVSDRYIMDTQHTIDVGQWNNGLYFLQLHHSDGTQEILKLMLAH